MSVPIVFDEWIFHELGGEDGPDKQQETFNLLIKLINICDKIVVLDDSPFVQKWDTYYAESRSDRDRRAMCDYLFAMIFSNELKIHKLTQRDIKPLPKDLIKLVPVSDHYLIQSYLKVQHKGGFVVTTDGNWKHEKLINKSMDIRMRDEFINQYMKG
jgi:hypothetical protein